MGSFNARLLPCKLCGHKATGWLEDSDDSSYRGWASAWCELCGQEVQMRPEMLRATGTFGPDDDELPIPLTQIAAVTDEVVRRWNAMNRVLLLVSPL